MPAKNLFSKTMPFILTAVMCLMLTGCGSGSLSDLIGKPRAKEIALADAGFPARWVIELKADFEHEDDRNVYDVSFINATTVYKYVIDGQSGVILQSETEPLFSTTE